MKVEEFTQAPLAQAQRVILGKEAQIRLILAALVTVLAAGLWGLPGAGGAFRPALRPVVRGPAPRPLWGQAPAPCLGRPPAPGRQKGRMKKR